MQEAAEHASIILTSVKVLGIIGPSGCGKSSLVGMLHAQSLVGVISTVTDRPRRPGEELLEHDFVSAERFDELATHDMFLEVVQPFGLQFRYGLPKLNELGDKIPLLMFRAAFIDLFRHHFPDHVIYQIECPKEMVQTQLQSRGDKNLGTRLSDFDEEVATGRQLAHRIFVNDSDLEHLAKEVTIALEKDF